MFAYVNVNLNALKIPIVFRYYLLYKEQVFNVDELIPFLLPLTMSLVAPNITIALKLWLIIFLISSTMFSMIGFNAGHHHPDIFHDGDIFRLHDTHQLILLSLHALRETDLTLHA